MNVTAIKLIGIFCIVIAAVEASRSYCREIRAKLRLAKDALRFVLFVRDAVSYHSTPVNTILESFETDEDELFEFYRRAASTSLSEALTEAKPPFDSTTAELLSGFAAQLGRTYTGSQLELCEATSEKLRTHIDFLESSVKNKERAAVATSFFLSATAILMLL